MLASGKRNNSNELSDIYTLELEDREKIKNLDNLNNAIAHIPAKHSKNGMKWTSLFIEQSLYEALDEAKQAVGLKRLGALAEVDVGIVTGRNSFFILNEDTKNELGASEYTIPIIGKTSVLRSCLFNETDFNTYKKQPSYLLNLNNIMLDSAPKTIQEYLKIGEIEGIHEAYKCRIRKRWFDIPSIYTPDVFLFRQIHHYPLLVKNNTRATSTDTIHRVRVKNGVDIEKLVSVFFNSLTLVCAEVFGRSYGGGVLELEPSEAEDLLIPYDEGIKIDIEKIDSLLRNNHSTEALDYVDNIVLKNHFGFDSFTIAKIRKAWEQLRDRRNKRHEKPVIDPSLSAQFIMEKKVKYKAPGLKKKDKTSTN